MSTDLKRRKIPFSPPDMTEAEAHEVRDAILSGWITTGPRTKKLEKIISEYVHTEKNCMFELGYGCHGDGAPCDGRWSW